MNFDPQKHGQEIVAAFTLKFPPFSGNNQYTASGYAHGKRLRPEMYAYRAYVRAKIGARNLADKKLCGPLVADWLVFPPDNRDRDDDNLLKVVKDALTHAGLWTDDSRKVIPETRVRWGGIVDGGLVTLVLREFDLEKHNLGIEHDCMEAGA